jgi:hypothetical protein
LQYWGLNSLLYKSHRLNYSVIAEGNGLRHRLTSLTKGSLDKAEAVILGRVHDGSPQEVIFWERKNKM